MGLPPEYILRQMSKLAMEEATIFFARMAREFAQNKAVADGSGAIALEAFARAIESRNAKQFKIPGDS